MWGKGTAAPLTCTAPPVLIAAPSPHKPAQHISPDGVRSSQGSSLSQGGHRSAGATLPICAGSELGGGSRWSHSPLRSRRSSRDAPGRISPSPMPSRSIPASVPALSWQGQGCCSPALAHSGVASSEGSAALSITKAISPARAGRLRSPSRSSSATDRMGRTLIRCDLTVTQNNNSIKGRIMAKAAVKNLTFSTQDKEIKAVRPQQRGDGQLEGRAGPQRAAGYHCPWGDPDTAGTQLWAGAGGRGAGGTGRTRGATAAPTRWRPRRQPSKVPAPGLRSPGEGEAPSCTRLLVRRGSSRTRRRVPAGLRRARRSCAPRPCVPRGTDLLPRLAAEADGDGPSAFASVSMKTSQRTSDGVEKRGNEKYPEELGSLRLWQLNSPRSGAQELTAKIQAQGSGPGGTRSRAGTASPTGTALPPRGEEGMRLSRQRPRPLGLGTAVRAGWDTAAIPGGCRAFPRAPSPPRHHH